MDVSEYIGGGFLKVADLTGGSLRAVIADVRPGKFDRPDMELQSGEMLGMNGTNLRTLRNAWGPDTAEWVGKEVELYVGVTQYQGRDMESILVKAISPPVAYVTKGKPGGGSNPMDDEIPFAPVWV